MKSMNMDIWIVGTSNQFFVRDSYTEIFFSKNKVVTGKTPFFCEKLCTPHSIYLNITFWQSSLVWKRCVFNFTTFN